MRSRAWLLGAVAAVLAACGGGGGGGDGGGVTPPPATVTISGRVTYDRVPFSATLGDGLNYTATFQSPVRQATVELLAALSGGTGSVLATTTTDTNGAYSVTVSSNANVFLRVKAQSSIEAASGASWSLSVYNNTNSNALYVLDSSTFNTGTSSRTLDLRATSGWQSFSGRYDPATRNAAPFAILDTVYEAVQFVLAEADSKVEFPALGVYWSPNNRASGEFSPSEGNIGTTSYRPPGTTGPSPTGIYLLGQENVDTDEYDAHVIAHEFQHYLEDYFGRTDTTGGQHSLQMKLDMRLAFSEGYSNAFAAMVLNDAQYRDSFGSRQGFDAGFSLESDPHGNRGWFSEASVGLVTWDAYDADNETGDTATIGFAPMWRVFRGELSGGPALTSIFPFITALKLEPGVPAAAIDAIVEAQEMVGSTMDIYATTETNDGGSGDNLPAYWTLSLNGPAVQVCGDADLGTYNLLGNRRFLRFSLAGARNVAIRATYVAQPGDPGLPIPNPDLVIYRAGFLDASESKVPYEELYRGSLGPGDYVVEVYEYSHVYGSVSVRPRTCMNISLTG